MTALPSLRQLGYLAALHEHRHFGRAATASFVTQSTLSAGVAELERLLEARLVERSTRSVRFTPVGEEVVARARGLLREAEDLVTAAQGAREPLVGALRMAAIPTIAPFLLPKIVTAIAARWPRLKLSVREVLTGAACEALQRGAADAVFLALPAECGEVEAFEIADDELLLAARADEPGAASEPPDPARLLLLDHGHCLRDHALAACDLSGAAGAAPLVASTLHTLVGMVDAGLGVTFLPRIAVASGILDGTTVRAHPLAPAGAQRRLALVWRKGDPRARELRLLGETIREAVVGTSEGA